MADSACVRFGEERLASDLSDVFKVTTLVLADKVNIWDYMFKLVGVQRNVLVVIFLEHLILDTVEILWNWGLVTLLRSLLKVDDCGITLKLFRVSTE